MRNPFLGSIWLATSLVLLTCGTALAQLSLGIQPGCIECCPLEGLGPCPGYTAYVTSSGWQPKESLILMLAGPGRAGPFGTGFLGADDEGLLELQLIFMCENPWLAEGEATLQSAEKYWWIHPEWRPEDYGLWHLEVRGDAGKVQGDFLFAEDCEAAEFVPEPGSLVLLGSGAIGLALYLGRRRRWRGV
jgi:hypothetical protein